jgi:hypothetical protein
MSDVMCGMVNKVKRKRRKFVTHSYIDNVTSDKKNFKNRKDRFFCQSLVINYANKYQITHSSKISVAPWKTWVPTDANLKIQKESQMKQRPK